MRREPKEAILPSLKGTITIDEFIDLIALKCMSL